MRPAGSRPRGRIASVLKLLFTYSVAILAAYGVTRAIYALTGHPPEIAAHLLTGLLAVSLVMLVWRLIILYTRDDRRAEHQDMHTRLTAALTQMGRGRFDILLDPDALSAYNELANAINDMAHNLETLETMRQDFISNVSHEIQSPLTSIGGFAALLRQDDLTDGQRRRYAAIIEAESKRLSSLSDNLLKLSALDDTKVPLSTKDFRLDRQLEHAALTLEPQWSAKKLTLDAQLEPCTLRGDEDLLLQVWVNLLHNAVKFTPEGGRIRVALTAGGARATVTVADTGVGIAPEDQIHVFERFYKADKARDRALGGNGLGLSLARKIVEMHGGGIAVRSEAGNGATFTVTLPVPAGEGK